MNVHRTKRSGPVLGLAVLILTVVLAGAGSAHRDADRWSVHNLTTRSARALPSVAPKGQTPTRAAASWCGTPSQADLVPNALAGNPVHWVYAAPVDGPDQLSTYGSVIQTDAESIDAWWRGQDPTRAPRSDVAPFSCGLQLDLTTIRLSQSSAQLAPIDTRFETIADALIALGFSSRHTKYLVYYDGPVELDVCGQGGSDSSGLGYAIVYVRACLGVPFATTAAHELLHTLGAVPGGAPHMCPEPDDGHVCDNPYDMMFPFGDETPIGGLALDSGRDDYYGHSGTWPDTQDSPWLVQVDRQVPFGVTLSGPGSVDADVPGLRCTQSCTTTWSADTALTLTATPAPGAKLVRWGSACTGNLVCNVTVAPGTSVSALFAPSDYRLTAAVSGRGAVRSSRPGIACPPRCSARVPSYEPLRLIPRPAKGWRFKMWKGACQGTKTACTVPMSRDASARAVFVRTY